MILDFDPPSATGRIAWDGGSIPILQKFHMIPFLDEVFRDVTIGFGPSTLEYDAPTWWQMFSFLNDFGVLYMICLLEATRPANKWTPAYFPAIMATIAQLGGGGVIIPLQYYLYSVFCPPVGLQYSADRRIDTGRAFIWLPLALLFNTIPLAGMYLSPDLNARHYWTWAWQLYSIRIALGYYFLLACSSLVPSGVLRTAKTMNYHTALRIILGPLIVISATVWINLLVNCPYSFSVLFIPSKNHEQEHANRWVGMIRRCLQYDELVVFGSAFLWLVYLALDMKNAGIWSPGKVLRFLGAFAGAIAVGPGAALGGLWLWREKDLVVEVGGHKSGKKRRA
ncbi:hypothetical protein K505DRAFT_227365 [Melanomma pulvis-pyrius CBS 109.77]|uniref:Uncharacterized protein n=1 Tax=Melanomma pulvis-pyrius CBS 109.77 TaxID=1314802 RepID=A0A6A6XX27_9PLEO|nr:hypothetical protein K505DRAFT_227365 [Melanomma pulvis-pyrius CBS 109.77]